jgi:flagellar biosynthesis/type III secretory pathway chaperone
VPMESLQSILKQLVEAHRELIDIGEQKKEALISNRVELLNEQVNKETRLIRHITALEKERLEASMNFLISRGYAPNPQVTLANLIQLVYKVTDKQALQEIHAELLEVTSRLKQLQQLNNDLLNHSMDYIEYSLNLMVGYMDDDATYSDPSKRNQQVKRPGFFDTKA